MSRSSFTTPYWLAVGSGVVLVTAKVIASSVLAREEILLPEPPSFAKSSWTFLSGKTILWAVLLCTVFPAIAGAIFAIVVRAYNTYVLHEANHYPPKPPGLFLLGSLPLVKSMGFTLTDGHFFRKRLHETYGKIVSIYAPATVLLRKAVFLGKENDLILSFVSDPAIVQDVMTDKKSIYQQRVAPASLSRIPAFFRDGMLGLPMGDEWTRHRRLLSPLFSENYLKAYAEVINDKAHALCQAWKKDCELGEPQKVSDGLVRVTLDVIGIIGFGKEFNSIQNASSAYVAAGNGVLRYTIRSFAIPSFLRKLDFRAERKGLQSVFVFEKLVDEMIAEFENEKLQQTKTGGPTIGSSDKKENFLRTLLEARDAGDDHLSDAAVKAELITMLIAGHETTAHTLSWALHYLAKSPEAQKRLHEEVDRVIPTPDSPVLYDEVSQLSYTKACFFEALRIMPTVPAFSRYVKEPKKYGEFTLPKNSIVSVNTYAMARDPDNWEDPDTYNPERFIERAEGTGEILQIKSPETAGQKRFAFLPFGSGPRSCLGKRLALNEGVAVLAIILRNFELEDVPSHDPGSAAAVTLSPKNGVIVKLSPRQ